MYCTQLVFVRSLVFSATRQREEAREEPTQLQHSVHPSGTMGICVAGVGGHCPL
jgi:hypothetical protein